VGPALRPILRPSPTLSVVEVGGVPARTAQPRLLVREPSLARRLTRATTANSSVIGKGIALSIKVDRGWKRQPVLTVSANTSPTKIYVTVEVNGEPIHCLLDSGCERSVISADPAPKAELNPSQYSLYAANKASLDVFGDTVIPFVIDGHAFEADVYVCSKVKDFLLGSDSLEKQEAQWDFTSGTVTLGGRNDKGPAQTMHRNMSPCSRGRRLHCAR